MNLDTNCPHGRTHYEESFIDLEEDIDGEYLSYDVYEICDNPDCMESWFIGATTSRDRDDKDV